MFRFWLKAESRTKTKGMGVDLMVNFYFEVHYYTYSVLKGQSFPSKMHYLVKKQQQTNLRTIHNVYTSLFPNSIEFFI